MTSASTWGRASSRSGYAANAVLRLPAAVTYLGKLLVDRNDGGDPGCGTKHPDSACEPQYPTPTTPTRIPSARARTSHPRLPRSCGLEFF